MFLSELGRQFSPQVVSAIKNGEIKLGDSAQGANICAIFVDIVNSTDRVTRIDNKHINKVISMFMEDASRYLLKYDLTIDKFMGDGVLAFSNAPFRYNDYIERTVRAAIELRDAIQKRQYLYENYWLNKFQIRIGVASGFANVGFYGSKDYYHSYTAIGPVVNLASRLCSVAEPNEIVIPYSVAEELDIECFDLEYIGTKNLKGFERDIIKAYRVLGVKDVATTPFDTVNCPKCTTLMHLDTNSQGIYEFICRNCGAVLAEDLEKKTGEAA